MTDYDPSPDNSKKKKSVKNDTIKVTQKMKQIKFSEQLLQ